MMKFSKILKFIMLFAVLMFLNTCESPSIKSRDFKPLELGEVIDEFNGVKIFYNGNPRNTFGRNKSGDGYNFGLKWQCVEFVKRYYFEYFNHRMPDTWGHAKDFVDLNLKSGAYNKKRGLHQFRNRCSSRPMVNDILVFRGNVMNKYGHIAIISRVEGNMVEYVQQNTGRISREKLRLSNKNEKWVVESPEILGWLGKR